MKSDILNKTMRGVVVLLALGVLVGAQNNDIGSTVDGVSSQPNSNAATSGTGEEDPIEAMIKSVYDNVTQITHVPLQVAKPFGEVRTCDCVPYYFCSNSSIGPDGNWVIDITSQDLVCKGYMEKCCYDPRPPDDPRMPKPLGHRGCGFLNEGGVGFRITGNLNNEAEFGEFPWMVAILSKETRRDESIWNDYQCGGALIHKQVVVTAAHCIMSKQPDQLSIRAGEWDTQTMSEHLPHQTIQVQQFLIHEKFYSGALYNDIALLILEKPVEYADNVDIICLPKQDDIVLQNNCLASGWGKDVFGDEGRYQVILKKIELPMVPREKCEQELRNTILGPRFHLHPSFVCAGGVSGSDTCKGDGGGPLVCPINGKEGQYQQVGIVAWGIGCGSSTPAVYVNLAHFRDWIDRQMGMLKFETEYDY